MSVTACRSCDAPIRWVRTVRGNLMPLDAAPDPAGNVEIIDGVAHVHGQPPLGTPELWTCHFYTCPDAQTWKKR